MMSNPPVPPQVVKGGNKKKKPRKKRNSKSQNGPRRPLSGSTTIGVGAAQADVVTMLEPEIIQSPGLKGSMRVRFTEYITDLVTQASTAYQLLFQGEINPADAGVFPWLSGVARRYEKYIPHYLAFKFRTSVGSGTNGSVFTVVEYEASDNAPVNKTTFLNQKGAVRSAPWQNHAFLSDPKDLKQRSQYYVNTGSLTIGGLSALNPIGGSGVGAGTKANDDDRLDDVGKIFVASQGAPASTTLGELWIEYDIELLTPQLGNEPNGCTFFVNSTSPGVSAAAPFGTEPAVAGKLDVNYDTTAGGVNSTWTFRDPGRYFVALDVDATVITTLAFALAAPPGGGQVPVFVTSAGGTIIESTVTGTSVTSYASFDVPEPNGRLTLSAAVLTTLTSASMSLFRISPDYIPL